MDTATARIDRVALGDAGVDADRGREPFEDLFVRTPRISWPRQQHEDWTRPVALLRVRQRQAALDGNG